MDVLPTQITSGIDDGLPPARDRAVGVGMNDREFNGAIVLFGPEPRCLEVDRRVAASLLTRPPR